MIYARVAGTGSFLPGAPVSNDDLVARGIDTSDEWISSRSGIRARHLAAADVGSSELARRLRCVRSRRQAVCRKTST